MTPSSAASPGLSSGLTPGPSTDSSRPAALTPVDLAELMAAFNEVTARLQATHESLRGEVARLTQELSLANDELARSKRLATLGEMAAGIAHEIRNPLGSISLFARLLRDDLKNQPQQARLAEKILLATRGLNEVIGDVLTFSREFRVVTEAADLRELVDRSVEACQHDGVPGWQRVQVVRPRSGETSIAIDSGLVQQALTNVVRNAIEAMIEHNVESPTLTIEIRKRQVRAATGGRRRYVCVVIRDNGPGLSSEVLDRMFNPFFTTRKAGTGLGLAIVHRIMDAHDGRVVAGNNADGRGATIELLFPLEAASSSGSPADVHPDGRADLSLDRLSDRPMEADGQKLPLPVAEASGRARRAGAA